MWEILTFGARPYKDKKPQEMFKYLESGQRLAQPPTCTIDLYKVLLKCETSVLLSSIAQWLLLAWLLEGFMGKWRDFCVHT